MLGDEIPCFIDISVILISTKNFINKKNLCEKFEDRSLKLEKFSENDYFSQKTRKRRKLKNCRPL